MTPRFTAEEKPQFVEETLQPGTNMPLVARRHGISPSLLFRWRKLVEESSLSAVQADESVVPVSQVQALEQQVQQLQRLLGKKTAECEILREAVEVGRAQKSCYCARHDRGRAPSCSHGVPSAWYRTIERDRATITRIDFDVIGADAPR